MRSGVWFKALRRIDRVLVELTIKVVDNIRSPNLAKSLLAIAGKLEEFKQSKFLRTFRSIGFPVAERTSQIALGWGNATADAWADDAGFARYWAVMKLNEHYSSLLRT